jgi:hypothetical protein
MGATARKGIQVKLAMPIQEQTSTRAIGRGRDPVSEGSLAPENPPLPGSRSAIRRIAPPSGGETRELVRPSNRQKAMQLCSGSPLAAQADPAIREHRSYPRRASGKPRSITSR